MILFCIFDKNKLYTMNKKLFSNCFYLFTFFNTYLLLAQNFHPLPIQTGFNADVIANGFGPAASTTNNDVDGVSFVFVSRDYKLTSSSPELTHGLPADGLISSVVASTPELTYQLADYNSNNSLRLMSQDEAGTLLFSNPAPAFKLYLLATSGSGSANVSVKVNFIDDTSQIFNDVIISNWYDGDNFALRGFGRINRTNNDVSIPNSTNPRLYQTLLTIDVTNQSKPIKSATVTKITGNGVANVLAFSIDQYSDCAPPILQNVGTRTENSADISWTVPTGVQANNYDIYYSTTNTRPTPGSTPQMSGLTGTSATISGLIQNTNYYYWVRANCSSETSQSVWSFSGTFKTLCGVVNSLFENFDSYSTGSIVPDCWVRLAGTGSQTITSTTPASGTRNIYQFNTASNTPTYVVLPIFSNINSGTHQLRLKARVSSGAPGTLIVGYVTNVADASTFVALQSLSITNTSYTSNAEYTVAVPNTVPANARLAIRASNDSKSYYWDDIYWETNPTMDVNDVNQDKKKLLIYPNPFNDIIYVSEYEKVASVTVNDISGRALKTINNPTKQINLSTLASGLYLVTFKINDGTEYTVKLNKK